jgi:hypothetical protein
MPLVNDIAALNPAYNKWYMDNGGISGDGGIIGDVELLKKVLGASPISGSRAGLASQSLQM